MSLSQEEVNLITPSSDPVDGMGWTILLAEQTTDKIFSDIVQAWKIVASIPRICDEEGRYWPAPDEIEARLPDWLSARRFAEYGFGFDTWCDDLNERDWIWWSSRRCASGRIRIDLKAAGMPMSDWTLWAVARLAGAAVIGRDLFHLIQDC